MNPVETKYAKSGDTHIAYQVVGEGDLDVVYVPGWVSHVELCWKEPTLNRFLSRIASFARLIIFDKRGTGLSDRVSNDQLPTLEERADDLLAVMDAANSSRAALIGFSEGGNLAAFFAASHPERTSGLVMFGAFGKRIRSPDYPWAPTPEERQKDYEFVEREWGNLMDLEHYAPSKANDEAFMRRTCAYLRRSASPGAAVTLLKMNTEIDLTNVLPAVHVPTLVLHRTGDRDANVEEGRWIADRISGAQFKELPGEDHFPWVGDSEAIIEEIQAFVTGEKPRPPSERVLATIMFTDIVGSTDLAHQLGDAAWKDLLNQHDQLCVQAINEHNGRLVKGTGDGLLATFDGPGRGISCGKKIVSIARGLGLSVRCGLHTGECELRGDEIAGVAVHLAARVSALAGADQLLVSRTVRDLVAGSGHTLQDEGEHLFKGFSEKWSIYSVYL
ncbi:adenylate/guanylate cyclase domain-containing protein [Tateyamaria pelophila]|uniref:adenylate/guanylate cyclase domain-containing protein n=1 Tax=Tateyamaria pelophila TaxID=328415 RepID=UPI001CBC0EA6|nr:adenylate/guanylate cyclase domain-containing protein [Tateyamaria pelophila]